MSLAEVIVTWTDHSVTVEWGGVVMVMLIAGLIMCIRWWS